MFLQSPVSRHIGYVHVVQWSSLQWLKATVKQHLVSFSPSAIVLYDVRYHVSWKIGIISMPELANACHAALSRARDRLDSAQKKLRQFNQYGVSPKMW